MDSASDPDVTGKPARPVGPATFVTTSAVQTGRTCIEDGCQIQAVAGSPWCPDHRRHYIGQTQTFVELPANGRFVPGWWVGATFVLGLVLGVVVTAVLAFRALGG